MLWATLPLSATVYASAVPRQNTQNTGDINLAAIIRNHVQVQAHMRSTMSQVGKVFPYSEGRMDASEGGVDLLNFAEIPRFERKCLFVRNSIKEEGWQSSVDINPHPNADDVVTGDKEETMTISKSTVKTNSQRLGWNKESATEVGGSVSVGASAGYGPFSASLDVTVYGNQRETNGQSVETSTSDEISTKIDKPTITGSCFLTPYYNEQCGKGKGGKGNLYSLGLLRYCSPSDKIADKFYEFILWHPGYSPDLEGIKMHKTEGVIPMYQKNCSFSYTLRDEHGTPVGVIANIIEKYSDPTAKKTDVIRVPKAVEWRETGAKDLVCRLQRGWSWMPPNRFYISRKDGGDGDWQDRDDLPEPEGCKEKRAEYMQSKSKRAEDEEDEEPPRYSGGYDNNFDKEEPPAYDRVKVVILEDGMPAFLETLGQSKSEGFVANRIDEAKPSSREVHGRAADYFPNVRDCLEQFVGDNGRG
ncbi:hypothetical protein MGU_08455 [Metarhizium guizhouense ARSEF 977]|uniref:Uncharacterized protein n=1 Tax=Metarhizium guizhouense (strain ARSEF 977) TaxID=1276136 RepID=A0A0B4HXL2_METGA|nr:hypothetical protein MGU_08455 [Metarhizium guizhouense ARSEF 977]